MYYLRNIFIVIFLTYLHTELKENNGRNYLSMYSCVFLCTYVKMILISIILHQNLIRFAEFLALRNKISKGSIHKTHIFRQRFREAASIFIKILLRDRFSSLLQNTDVMYVQNRVRKRFYNPKS